MSSARGAGAFGVEVRGLSKRFGEHDALVDVSFAVPTGTVLGLLGPNGAGKTTMVRILATLVAADAGLAFVAGCNVANDPGGVRRALGLTGQFAAVDDRLTGRENLVLFGRLRGLNRPGAHTRAVELLEQFDLLASADKQIATYSGGMRRRLDIGLSLVVDTQVLVLDEPTTGLDPKSRLALWDVIRSLRDGGTTILLTTQYLEEADQLADDIVVIDAGRVVAHGTAGELKAQVGSSAIEVGVDVASLGEVVEVMAGLGLNATIDKGEAKVSAPAPHGWATLAAVGEALDDTAIQVDDIGLRRPSLDDAFLALTGHNPSGEGRDDPAISGAE